MKMQHKYQRCATIPMFHQVTASGKQAICTIPLYKNLICLYPGIAEGYNSWWPIIPELLYKGGGGGGGGWAQHKMLLYDCSIKQNFRGAGGATPRSCRIFAIIRL